MKTKTKIFEIHFRHRDDGTLNDVFERGEAKSKAAAVLWGKAIAAERGWWFMGAELANEERVSIAQAPNGLA